MQGFVLSIRFWKEFVEECACRSVFFWGGMEIFVGRR